MRGIQFLDFLLLCCLFAFCQATHQQNHQQNQLQGEENLDDEIASLDELIRLQVPPPPRPSSSLTR